MTAPERLRRVRSIFQSALDRPDAEREAFVADACGDDADLLRNVQALLRHDAGSTSPLDAPVFDVDGALAATAEPDADEMIGRDVGGCRLLRRIGAGGMGVVYEAEQRGAGRHVAIKLVGGARSSPESRWRFEREIAVLSRLEHPRIARLYDAGVHRENGSELPFLVMELIEDARTIVEHAEAESLSVDDRLRLFLEVGAAVSHGHVNGIVHRDLKPDNILVNARGEPMVIDFGVARALAENTIGLEATMTRRHLVGSLCSMAPEQLDADGADADARSDVYALGAVLFELLTGRRPIELGSRSFMAAARHILDSEPARLAAVDARFRGDLDSIVATALARLPGQRYQSVHEFARDVERFLEGEPVEARRTERWYRVRRTAARYRAAIAIGAAVIIGLTAAAVVYRRLYDRAETQRALLAERTEDLGTTNYHNLIALAESALKNENVDESRRRLDECPADRRGWEWGHLSASLDDTVARIPVADGGSPLGIAPDGRQAAGVSPDGSIVSLLELPSGRISWNCPVEPDPRIIARWSPNGRVIALRRRHLPMLLLDTTDGDVLAEIPGGAVSRSAFDRHGRLAIAREHVVTTWSASGPWEPATRFELPDQAMAMAFSDDDHWLAVGCHDGSVIVHDRRAGEVRHELQAHPAICGAVLFSPDGNRLYTGGWDGFVREWDLRSGAVIRVMTAELAYHPEPDLSPDGRTLAFSDAGTIRLCDVLSGDITRTLRGLKRSVSGITFDSGGRILGHDGSDIATWDPAAAGASVVRDGHADWIDWLAYSHDGTWLASAGREHVIMVRDAVTHEAIARLTAPASRIIWAGFSPDDRHLVCRTISGDVRIWSTRGFSPVADAQTGGTGFAFAAWLDDGHLVTPGADGDLLTLELPAGTVVSRLPTGQVGLRAICLSSDRVHLLTTANTIESGVPVALLWRRIADEFADPRALEHDGPVTAAAFTPDGAHAVTGSLDGTLRVWSVETGACLRTLSGHQGNVMTIGFVQGGNRLVSSEYPEGIRLWDLDSGRLLLVFEQGGSRFAVQPGTDVIASDHARAIGLLSPR